MNQLFDALKLEAVAFSDGIDDLPVTPSATPGEIRKHLDEHYDFSAPISSEKLIADVSAMLRRWSLLVTHRRYFGLFNPTVRPITVAADALAALFNPQLAVWRHAPIANEMERHLLRFLSNRIGFDPGASVAHFTSGGQEANFTAVLAALTAKFPSMGEEGLRGLSGQPVIYLSEESHHSFHKIAHATGMGRSALRVIRTDETFRLDAKALVDAIAADLDAGLLPFMVVGTAGTTSTGAVDGLEELGGVCREKSLWYHVDAAWGGTALLSQKLRRHLRGIELADSVTWDAHKWLSVPLGAGMFFCRHPEPVSRAFAVSASNYVPPGEKGTHDNYVTTMQWSRRFIGLKVFMALAEQGADGYAGLIERQSEMGDLLRERLAASGWTLVNDTPLPVVCFTHENIQSGSITTGDIVEQLNRRGRAWISEVTLPGEAKALRACITSYRTDTSDLEILLDELSRVSRAHQRIT